MPPESDNVWVRGMVEILDRYATEVGAIWGHEVGMGEAIHEIHSLFANWLRQQRNSLEPPMHHDLWDWLFLAWGCAASFLAVACAWVNH